jgi:hypothetical protein
MAEICVSALPEGSMQVAGKQCRICQSNISAQILGTWCAVCHTPFHSRCLESAADICVTCGRKRADPRPLWWFSSFCPKCMTATGGRFEYCPKCGSATRWDTHEDYLRFLKEHRRDCWKMGFAGFGEIIVGLVVMVLFVGLILAAWGPGHRGLLAPWLLVAGAPLIGHGVFRVWKAKQFAGFK